MSPMTTYPAQPIFLSTPSARRATQLAHLLKTDLGISIHALREEGDRCAAQFRPLRCISIHALREEGDAYPSFPQFFSRIFLSTPSARRATVTPGSHCAFRPNFYPRPPRGGRLLEEILSRAPDDFYPRPPRGGRRLARRAAGCYRGDFYPRPPRGGRRACS